MKANEHKSGHSGTETIYRRCVQEKSQEGKDRLSKCSGGAPVFDLKGREKATAGQELPFQFVETEISLYRRASLI